MLYPLHSLNLNILQVFGRSDLFLRLEIYKKTIAVIPIVLGVTMGIYWMLISSVIVSFISYFINAYYSGPLLNYNIKSQVKDILPSLVVSLAGAGVAFFIYLGIYNLVYSQCDFWPNLAILFLTTICGTSTTWLLLRLTHNPEYGELVKIMHGFIIKISKRI